MAGTYGLKTANYEKSQNAGRPMLAELEKSGLTYGATECSSCRMQMEDGTRKRTFHPAQYLAYAYGLMPELQSASRTLPRPGAPMMIAVHFFARARDLAGTPHLTLEIPDLATVGDLRRALAERLPPWRRCSAILPLLSTTNLPATRRPCLPVRKWPCCRPSAAGRMYARRRHDSPYARAHRLPGTDGAGSTWKLRGGGDVSWHGARSDGRQGARSLLTTRRIPAWPRRSWRRSKPTLANAGRSGEIAVEHRLGRLEVGDISVAVAVSCPHRAQAFEACRHAIDRLKELVPIWKKENWADGSTEWVHPGT